MLRMILFGVVIFHTLIMTTTGCYDYGCPCVEWVSRRQWGALQPISGYNLQKPIDTIIIHHTDMSHCNSFSSCRAEMKKVQDDHMGRQRYNDIGFNFLVGEDGRAYEGRGWNQAGEHTESYNRKSLSIAVMGDFTSRVPNSDALSAINNIIQCGVDNKNISSYYRIIGHRDIENTLCPGERFYQLIRTWPHYSNANTNHRGFYG